MIVNLVALTEVELASVPFRVVDEESDQVILVGEDLHVGEDDHASFVFLAMTLVLQRRFNIGKDEATFIAGHEGRHHIVVR